MRPDLIVFLLLLALANLPAIAAGSGPAAARTAAAPPAIAATAQPAARLPRIHLHGSALTGKERALSVDELDTLTAAAEWTIDDPYSGTETRYQGIVLRDLVKALAPNAQRVRMRAINDYIVVFNRREWETLPILLATRDEGVRMSVANKGPARIIYRQTRENELRMQVHAPKWIWQVIDVEFDAH